MGPSLTAGLGGPSSTARATTGAKVRLPRPPTCAPLTHLCAVAMLSGSFTSKLMRSRSPVPAPRIFDGSVSYSSRTRIFLTGSCSRSHQSRDVACLASVRAGAAVRVPCLCAATCGCDFSPALWSQPMILGCSDTFSPRCARKCAACCALRLYCGTRASYVCTWLVAVVCVRFRVSRGRYLRSI